MGKKIQKTGRKTPKAPWNMMYLFDSDILMDFFKKKEYATQLIKDLTNKKGKLAISTLSVAELRSGWTKEQAEHLLPKLYDLVRVFMVDKAVAELAGQFRQEYKIQGITLPVVDTLIAATAILERCQLVTRNKKDYPMSEIKLYPIGE